MIASEALTMVPSMREDRSRWTKEFVEFVAMRGYAFRGHTNPLSSSFGAELDGWASAKAAIRLIEKKWFLLEDATCKDRESNKRSVWRLWFGAEWKVDRRVVGFWVEFEVDALGWALMEMFDEAAKLGQAREWPDPRDPLASSQKDWEGWNLSHAFMDKVFGMNELVACLRKGGSPFAEGGGRLIGEPMDEFGGSAETKAFMAELREAVGGPDGWHLRIAPLLTDSGINALQDKAAVKQEATQPKLRKKSLKDRSDIL
ncbi:hypothetical protein LP419_29960 [Massilia sp. H-1]|nr:hypothetical protein LP419_29960 [Massilia sp. H-1]